MTHNSNTFWRPWKEHWLYVFSLFVLGPSCGYFFSANPDRGLLFGLAISVFASGWLLCSRLERKGKS